MAGVSGNKRSQKFKNQNVSAFSNEILKDSDVSTSHQIHTVKPSFGLRGILGLGQSIEINKEELKKWLSHGVQPTDAVRKLLKI